MADEIRRQQPDLVHVHWTQLGHALAAMDSGIPYVVTIHDAALTCAYWNWSWRLGPALCTLGGLVITRKILRQASHVVAVSPYVSDHVKRFFLPPGYSSISIIPNPVSLSDTSGFKFQVSNDSPVFAAIGHWGPLKNFSLALRAFALVRGSLPHAKLVLVGKDLGTGTPCHAWAVRHGLESGVDFRGPMAHADLMAFLSNDIDCLVHPARTEGFSLVVADAMAAGVPVVAAAAGALPWLLGNGAFGTLVDSRAPAPWAEAMIEAATGTGSSSLLERARERIASLCDPRRIAAQHMEVYARVVKRPGS
jgi:glycosyltransferase involved in cell wall biosynthesis